tara:strand:+ start:299 stop:445 length:147 start_codon:yes stop_codon:yes gene_type:complete
MPDNTSWPFNRTWHDNDGEIDLYERYERELEVENDKFENETKDDEEKT